MRIIRPMGVPALDEGPVEGGDLTPRRGTEFRALFRKAQEAGRVAAEKTSPKPPILVQEGVMHQMGATGVTWVTVKPGNAAFARWLIANNLASKAFGGGVQIWINDYRESRQRQEAYAHAMVQVLIDAEVARSVTYDSRED